MLQLLKKTVFLILAAISVAVLVGTWHFEKIGEKQRYFERLTFQADGTLTGMRKWQMRKLVTINGEQVYTDWEDVELGGWEDEDVKQNGTFSGTWKLRYWDPYGDGKQNYLELSAKYDNKDIDFAAYQYNAVFDYTDETTLRFKSYYISGENGWMIFQRGEAEPSF